MEDSLNGITGEVSLVADMKVARHECATSLLHVMCALIMLKACKDTGEPAQARSAPGPRALLRWLLQLALVDAALWALYGALAAGVQPASRRACNAAYAAWLLALNLLLLLALAGADALCSAVQHVRSQACHASMPVLRSQVTCMQLFLHTRACPFLLDMDYLILVQKGSAQRHSWSCADTICEK